MSTDNRRSGKDLAARRLLRRRMRDTMVQKRGDTYLVTGLGTGLDVCVGRAGPLARRQSC